MLKYTLKYARNLPSLFEVASTTVSSLCVEGSNRSYISSLKSTDLRKQNYIYIILCKHTWYIMSLWVLHIVLAISSLTSDVT